MKTSLLSVFVVLTIVASCLVVCGVQPATAQAQEVINLKFTTYVPPVGGTGRRMISKICEEIESRTNGKLKFTIYWSQSLVKAPDEYDTVRDGIADMAFNSGASTPGRFLTTDVGSLPYACKDAFNNVRALHVLKEKGYFDKEYRDVELLWTTSTPPYGFLFRKAKPLKFEDLAGIRSRTPGGYQGEYLRAIGMAAVQVQPGELFSAYERGLVDAFTHNPNIPVKFKLHEVRSRAFLLANYAMYANGAFIFNKKRFRSFSPDIQEIIRDVVKKYAYEHVEIYLDENRDAKKILTERGIEFYEWPESEMAKMRAHAVKVWEKFISDCERKGLPGKQLIADYVAELKKLGEEPVYDPK